MALFRVNELLPSELTPASACRPPGRIKKEQALSRISDESLDKIPEEEEESPVFKELPGAKGTDEAVLPLTGGGSERSAREGGGDPAGQTNGGHVLPNGRVYGKRLTLLPSSVRSPLFLDEAAGYCFSSTDKKRNSGSGAPLMGHLGRSRPLQCRP